jgi:hypothetical protein
MKHFVRKMVLFLILIGSVGAGLTFILPEEKYWGNPEYEYKLRLYKKDNYNTVFFGTSRIYRGINPLVVDSIMNLNGSEMKSFNMATHASWANETLYLYDQFLDDPKLSAGVTTVFMEFQNIMAVRPTRLLSEKAIYYQNVDHYWFILRYAADEVMVNPERLAGVLYTTSVYTLGTAINLSNIKRISTKRTVYTPEIGNEVNSRGYLTIDELSGEFEKPTEEGISTYTNNIRPFLKMDDAAFNSTFFHKLSDLIVRSNRQGIKLIFVLPPVRLTEGMIGVFNAIPASHKIEVADPDKYHELYGVENWLDRVHLNARGSKHLTDYFINAYKKLDGLN